MALISIGDIFGRWKVIGFDSERSKNKYGKKILFLRMSMPKQNSKVC